MPINANDDSGNVFGDTLQSESFCSSLEWKVQVFGTAQAADPNPILTDSSILEQGSSDKAAQRLKSPLTCQLASLWPGVVSGFLLNFAFLRRKRDATVMTCSGTNWKSENGSTNFLDLLDPHKEAWTQINAPLWVFYIHNQISTHVFHYMIRYDMIW